MPKPVKLEDFLSAIRGADSSIQCSTRKGKGSHWMLWKETDKGTIPFPIPTSSGEVLGPYQKKVIELFGLPKNVFEKNKKKQKAEKKKSESAGE